MSEIPSAEQIADLRADIGDANAAYSDAEIERLWYRVRGAKTETSQHEATLALMARQLLMNAAKLRDYTAGQSSEKMSQVFDHLREIYEMFYPALETALNPKTQIRVAALRPLPRRERDEP